MLLVYELKGNRPPRGVPEEGLAGMWPQPPYYYLFYRGEPPGSVLKWLESNPEWLMTAQYSLPYEKWQDVPDGRLSVGPFRIGAKPCSGTPPVGEPGIAVLIDPGVVFGSGLHPTTRGCLLAIPELFASRKIRTAVDFGTGTGILAIACTLLGARRTLAIDCNPLALAVARRNAAANGAAEKIGFVSADRLDVISAPSDLLVMNLEWPILEGVMAGDAWKGYRNVILAGFLEGVLGSVEEMFRPWYEAAGIRVIEGWPVVTLIRAG